MHVGPVLAERRHVLDALGVVVRRDGNDRAAVTAAADRRRLASRVLKALEAAGLQVEPVDTSKVAKDTDAMLQDVHTKVSEIHTILHDFAKALPTIIAALDASPFGRILGGLFK